MQPVFLIAINVSEVVHFSKSRHDRKLSRVDNLRLAFLIFTFLFDRLVIFHLSLHVLVVFTVGGFSVLDLSLLDRSQKLLISIPALFELLLHLGNKLSLLVFQILYLSRQGLSLRVVIIHVRVHLVDMLVFILLNGHSLHLDPLFLKTQLLLLLLHGLGELLKHGNLPLVLFIHGHRVLTVLVNLAEVT